MKFLRPLLLFVACFSSLALAETEPNDLLGEATPIAPNGSMTATMDLANDTDWFQITVPGPGRLTASISSPPANMRTRIDRYTRHANYAWISRTAINPGDDLDLAMDVTEAGRYFVRVGNADGQATATPYTLEMDFIAVPDAHEPNGEVGQAALVNSSNMSGTIFPASEQDWFRIFVTKDDNLTFRLSTPSEMRGEIALYNKDFNYLWVSEAAANPGDTVILNHQATESGMLYLRIRDLQGRAHLSGYSLNVTGGTPGFVPGETPVTAEVEDNGTIGLSNLINLSSNVTGTIADSGDLDWFTFVPTQTGQATFSLDEAPANLSLEMVLYNDSGATILSSRAGGPGGLFSMTFDIASLDRHYLRVRNLDNATSLSSYQFSSSIVNVSDPFEPNNDYGDRAVLGSVNQIEGWFFPASDRDWYEIQVTTPGELRAILNDLPENITPRINLYNLSRQHIAGTSGTPGTDLELGHTIGSAGTYLLEVYDGHGNESTLPYTLTIFGADFTQFAPIATIDSIDPGAIVVGSPVTFSGSGTDADGTVGNYEWTSNIDGPLGTLASFSSSALSIGTHTISFRVRDNSGIWSTKVVELLYVGSSVSEEAEPNESFFTADEIALNQPVTAKIQTVGDVDYFKFYVPRAGRIEAKLTNVPSNLRMSEALYNRYWDYLWISGAATTAGDNVAAIYDVTEAGFVYLRVKDDGGQANPDFTYTLTVHFDADPDPFEPNHDTAHATELTAAGVESYFFPSSDSDWYKVWVPAGGTLEAEVVSVPGNVRAEIALYGPDREYLWRNETGVNPGDSVSAAAAPAPLAAYYYIRVRALVGINWEDSYTLNITGADPGFVPDLTPLTAEDEDNNTISKGNSIATGSPVSGTLQPAGDYDWFQFVISTPGILHVKVEEIPDAIRAQVGIYRDDTGHIVSRTASNPGDDLAMDLRISDPGTYHLRFNTADSGQASPDPYALALTFTPVVDVNEPNNRMQDATVLSHQNRSQGYLFNVGDADYYRVHSESGSHLRVSLGDVPAAIRPRIDIYNHDGSHLASKLASNDGQGLTLTYVVPETADYSILIRDIGNNSFSSDPYILVIDGAVFDSYVPLATIDSVTPNPAGLGESVTFQGHGDDVDGAIIGYEWRSSIDGVFSISQVAESSSLTPGEHTISFRVKDHNGNWSPEVATLLYFGVSAPTETEPNNVGGSATPMDLGKQYTGVMNGAGDQDWFRIHVAQAGRLTINTSNPLGSAMRTNINMYTPDLDYAWINSTASNDGDPVTLTWDLDLPGDYYFYLKDSSNRDGGEYTVSANLVAAPDPFEPNSDITHAAPIAPDEQIEAYIFPSGEYDWYSVTLPTPGTLQMSITPVPGDLRMTIDVYGRNLEYAWVSKTANNPGDEVFLSYDAPVAGTYFLRVKSTGGTNPSDPYTLATQFTPAPDVFEPNPGAGSSAWLTESPVQGYIFPASEQDWYRVYADPGSTLEFIVGQVPDNLRMELALYNSEQGYLWVSSAAGAAGDPVTLTYPDAGGVYYLRVRDLDGARAAGETYQLSVTGANLAYRPSTTPATAETEPNNAYSTATLIGTAAVTGSFNGDEDWFRFELTKASELSVNLAVSANHRSRIMIYDESKTHLATREAENKGDSSMLRFPFRTPGVYYLRVYDADGASSADAYTLDMDLLSVPDAGEPNNDYVSATPVAFGAASPGMIFPQGDRDWFLVEVTEPGTLVLDLSGVPATLEMGLKLYDQNGTNLGGVNAMHGGDSLHFRKDLEIAASYRVELFDTSNDEYSADSYTFTANFVPANDSNEPNDLFRDAAPLVASNQTRGLIQPAGDEDWFSFSVDQPGMIRVQATQTGGINPRLRLYNDSKQQLTTVATHNTGDSIMLSYSIPVADTYYLLVQDDGNNQTSTAPYVVTVEGGAFANHHPIAEMPSCGPNPALTGEFVHLSGQGTASDGTIVGYEWISDLDGFLGSQATLDLPSLSPGHHRVSLRVLDNADNWSGRVARSLIVAPELGSESEYNNTYDVAVSIPLDQWVVGTINPGGDVDYYKIHVAACGLVRILVDAVPDSMRPELQLYNEDGSYAWIANTAWNNGERLSLNFHATPGWYLLRVRDANGQSHGDESYAMHCSLESGADPHEPNEGFAEATPIGPDSVLSDATICPSGEYDYYRVELTQPGRLSLELRHLPVTMRGVIDLYDQNFNYLWVSNTSINGGDSVPLVYDAVTPRVIYIRVRNTLSASEPQPYELSSIFTPVVDPYEPNDSAGQSSLLGDSANHGTIFASGDHDWYKIWLESGATLNLSVTGVPDGMRANLALYDSDYSYLWVSQTANNPGDNVYLSYTAPAAGMYLIRLRDDAGRSHLDPYILTVTGGTLGYEPPFAPQTVEAEDNSSWTTANDLALDTNLSGQITPNGDQDYFRIQVNQPGVLVVSHTALPTEIISEMWVYDASHGQVGYRRTTLPGEDNILELPIVAPGAYFVRLRDYGNNNSSTEIYHLRVTHTPVIDPNEPNNSIGAAATLGASTVSGYLFDGSDHDFYQVYVRNPGPLSLSLDTVPAVNRPHLDLYDPSGAHLGGWVNTNPGVGGNDLFVHTVPTPGFYYVRVRDEDSNYASDPYTLRITGADFSTAPLLAPIGDRSFDETLPYAFTITATDPDNPEDLVFTATNLPSGASFDSATRTFSWTPVRGQAGSYVGVHFEVSDGAYTDSEDITLTVGALDRSPVLHDVGNKQGHAGIEMSFQISGSDPDAGDVLVFSADNLPGGATFDSGSRTFAWTPAANQIGTHRNILFRVTDGERTDFEYIDIEITAPPLDYEAWLEDYFSEEERNDPAISGPDADPDADGETNSDEFAADTDPNDRNSVLRVTGVVVGPTGIDINWQGGIDSIQYLERSFDLSGGPGAWEVRRTVNPPTATTNAFHDLSTGQEKAFYRIRVQRP